MTAPEPAQTHETRRWTAGRLFLLILHWAIIANFAFEIAYAGLMVFGVLKPEGTSGPLFTQALSIPHELMVTRRLYATEFWIATAGLSVYLAITEIGPRMWGLPRR